MPVTSHKKQNGDGHHSNTKRSPFPPIEKISAEPELPPQYAARPRPEASKTTRPPVSRGSCPLYRPNDCSSLPARPAPQGDPLCRRMAPELLVPLHGVGWVVEMRCLARPALDEGELTRLRLYGESGVVQFLAVRHPGHSLITRSISLELSGRWLSPGQIKRPIIIHFCSGYRCGQLEDPLKWDGRFGPATLKAKAAAQFRLATSPSRLHKFQDSGLRIIAMFVGARLNQGQHNIAASPGIHVRCASI